MPKPTPRHELPPLINAYTCKAMHASKNRVTESNRSLPEKDIKHS